MRRREGEGGREREREGEREKEILSTLGFSHELLCLLSMGLFPAGGSGACRVGSRPAVFDLLLLLLLGCPVPSRTALVLV